MGDTTVEDIEKCFERLKTRPDIGVIIITQNAANQIRMQLTAHQNCDDIYPVVLEIPAKDSVYKAKDDPVMQRVARSLGKTLAQLCRVALPARAPTCQSNAKSK